MFTEALPEQIPARARITTRARGRPPYRSVITAGRCPRCRRAGHGLADRARRVRRLRRAGAARRAAAGAGPRDRRDPPREGPYETDPVTGAKTWVDRFDTGLVDLGGDGGLFAQVNGRTSAAVIAWLQSQDPEWRAGITHVSMDTSATYARAARLALPHATSSSIGFIWSPLANRAVTEYRRELAWARRGRRGRKIDPEWAQRNRLLRAGESLTDDEPRKCTTRCAR